LLNNYANAFSKIADTTSQAAKYSYYFTKEGISTIVDNAVSILNIPQHWESGKEFLRFMIVNNTKLDLQSMENHLAFTAACAKTLGCSQDTIDSFHQAGQNCSDASDLLVKTSFDIFIEHSTEILDKSIENFQNAPPEEKAAILGRISGHFVSFFTTPCAISKLGKGVATAA